LAGAKNQTNVITKFDMKASTLLKYSGALLLSAALSFPTFAQEKDKKDKKDAKQPGEAEMMAMMMEMAKMGENHKLLQEGVGTWSYKVKWWMSPDAPPTESSGTTTSRAIMNGRYIVSDHTGKMQMPGADGKMADMEFKGMATEGYDNAKKKFVATWVDNMGTGIMYLLGSYDATAKKFSYEADYEAMPGMVMKVREVLTVKDKDHRMMEFFEDRGGTQVKTMEISYTRKA
jgi:hypothetical protein